MTLEEQFNEVKEEISLIFVITAFVAGMAFGEGYRFYSSTDFFEQAIQLALYDALITSMMTAAGLGTAFTLARLAGYEVTEIQ